MAAPAAAAWARRASNTTRQQPTPSTGGQIQADPATNSLIITAPEPQYRQLRAVIDQLDGAAPRCWSKA
jgi:general secretion pathway protein D